MKLAVHILTVFALVALLLPCSHAVHRVHDEVSAERCASWSESCCEHTHEEHECAGQAFFIKDLAVFPVAEIPTISIPLFLIPEIKPIVRDFRPPVSAFLSSIQTVQLLI